MICYLRFIFYWWQNGHNYIYTKSQTRRLPWAEVDDVVVVGNALGDVVVDALIDVVEVGMGFFAVEMYTAY